MPGGKPVIDVPGLSPTFPMKTPGPVLVSVELARATKLAAEPRLGATAAGRARALGGGPLATTKSAVKLINIDRYLSFCVTTQVMGTRNAIVGQHVES